MFWYFKKHTRMTKSLFLHALPFPHRHCKCYSDYRTDQQMCIRDSNHTVLKHLPPPFHFFLTFAAPSPITDALLNRNPNRGKIIRLHPSFILFHNFFQVFFHLPFCSQVIPAKPFLKLSIQQLIAKSIRAN